MGFRQMKPLRQKYREHPLDEWLSFEQESIAKFKKGYPDLWQVFGDSINLARAVPYVISQQARRMRREPFL